MCREVWRLDPDPLQVPARKQKISHHVGWGAARHRHGVPGLRRGSHRHTHGYFRFSSPSLALLEARRSRLLSRVGGGGTLRRSGRVPPLYCPIIPLIIPLTRINLVRKAALRLNQGEAGGGR